MRRLAIEKQDKIRSLASSGVSNAEIARIMGCHVQTIYRVLRPEVRERHRIRSQQRNRTENTKDQRARQNKAQRERTAHASIVYILYSADHDLYKIGVTVNLTYRVRQMHCPDLSLLESFPGDRSLERYLHGKLEERWTHGEWFKFTSPQEAVQLCTQLVKDQEGIL